jgi:15-cis-phytoene desaturase
VPVRHGRASKEHMSTVYILGGGVAGLSAAHELSERDFDVVVFEQHGICGGKARSMPNSAPGRHDLPGEHGFRFFPGFYWHLSDTMQRIIVDPVTNATAFDNLVTARDIAIAQDGKPLFKITAIRPNTLVEWIAALREVVENPSLGIPIGEARFFVRRLLCFVGSGRTRRLKEYEGKSWFDFIDAASKSDQYKAILARGLSQSLVAMRPDKASALTVGTMLVQILFNIIEGKKADRVLNAPTNEAWIDPWVAHLSQNPKVRILRNHTVTQITYNAGTNTVSNVIVLDQATNMSQTWGTPQDYFISALPVDIVQQETLFPTSFKRAAGLSRPSTDGSSVDAGVNRLETEWMAGLLFYMKRDVSAIHGHVIHSNSRWAITSISQRQFWRAAYPWGSLGNGAVNDIFSTIISDWDTPGNKVVTTPAKKSKKKEIFDEAWAQAKAHLAMAGTGALSDADRVPGIEPFLDPAIKFDSNGVVIGNDEPLLINTKSSRAHRPVAKTRIPNFVVASDYVLTETDLACMEAANEAARHAVNAVLQASGSTKPACRIQKLEEPPLFRRFQDIDEQEYAADPSAPPVLCRLAELLEPSPTVSPAQLRALLIALLIISGLSLTMLGGMLYLALTR